MFAGLRKKFEDSLDAVEQSLVSNQIHPRTGSGDSVSPPARSSGEWRRSDRKDSQESVAGITAALAPAGTQLVESFSSIRKTLGQPRGFTSPPSDTESDSAPKSNAARDALAKRLEATSRAPGRGLSLQDRLKANFAIGEASGGTSAAGSRSTSPAPPSIPTNPSSDSQLSRSEAPASVDPTSVLLPESPALLPAFEPSPSEQKLSNTEPEKLPEENTDPPSLSLASEAPQEPDVVSLSSPTRNAASLPLPMSPPSQTTDDPLGATSPLLPQLSAVLDFSPRPSLDGPPIENTGADDEADAEKLRERLTLVQQRFSDVSKSFKRIQAEKVAAERLLKEMTPVESITDVDGLRDYLQNLKMKTDISTEEIKRLNLAIQQHGERVEELRDTHRLETKSQSQQIDLLQQRLAEAEVLIKASGDTTSSIAAASSAKQMQIDQLKAELEKAKSAAKDEEDKRVKAISLLKTVRTKLVQAEKAREDSGTEIAAVKSERDAARAEVASVKADIANLRAEKERDVSSIRAQFEREMNAFKDRIQKEAAAKRGEMELEAITTKAANNKLLESKNARINQLETSIRGLTQEKDALFDQTQLRQAELESAQAHLEELTNQNSELQYQLREANDRIAMLSEEAMRPTLSPRHDSDSYVNGGLSPSPEPPVEVARLLQEAEGKYESRLSELRSKIRSLEKERTESEEEWARNVSERGKEIERMKKLIADKEAEHANKASAWEDSEARIAALERSVSALTVQRDELAASEAVLKQDIERARDAEGSLREDKQDAESRISMLERQIEDIKTRESQLRSANKTLRDELRKVQSSAALLERQRNPGVGYWAASNGSNSRLNSDGVNGSGPSSPKSPAPPAEVQPRRSSSSNGAGPSGDEEAVNLEYLRNVILQFLENEKMRPDLVRVLSIILRFTPQETRRLLAKVA